MSNKNKKDKNNKNNNGARNDRDALLERLGMNISRRSMLKGMGYGLAGAMIAPSLIKNVSAAPPMPTAVALTDFAPVSIWDARTPPDYRFSDAPLYDGGQVIVPATAVNKNEWLIYSLDAQTRETLWTCKLDNPPHTPLSVNGALYLADFSAYIYSIDSATGTLLWKKPYHVASALQMLGGNLVFTTTDGYVRAIDLQGNPVWSYNLGFTVPAYGASRAVASNDTVMVLTSGGLKALDLQTGAFLWNHYTTGQSIADPSVGGGMVYITDPNGLYAIDVSSGNEVWRWVQGANPIALTPAYSYNGVVYVGDAGGNFRALAQNPQLPNAGMVLWEAGVNQSLTYPGGNQIFFEDGIAYFGAGTLFQGAVFALDLASQGEKIVSYNPSSGGGSVAAGVSIVGIETGVCYFQWLPDESYISAVNMAGIIHQYFCESELMVEDYQSSASHPNGYQGNTSSYRTHVLLVDENKNPRADKSVKVWASDAVTLSSGGQSYQLNPLNPNDPTGDTTTTAVWLTTDAAGELSLVSSASTVSSPALYIWGNFMELDEAIVIYPDHDTLNTLSTVQSSALSGATSFDGTLMLPSGYGTTDALAQSLRSTMGGGAAQAMLATREKNNQILLSKRLRRRGRWVKRRGRSLGAATATTYISYPASTTNMLYQAVAGDASRGYVPGSIQQWHAVFDASGNITFNQGLPPDGFLASPGSLLGDFKKFAHDVVNTAVKVATVVWDDVANAVKVIVNAAGDFYHDAVDSIEKAVAVVAGLLKTVIGDIKKAVEWLSYLFDWEDMLSVKNQLKTVINQKFTDLKTWTDNQIANEIKDVHNFFAGMENTLLAKLGQAQIQPETGGTMQSKQVNGNDPQTAYGKGGAKSYTKSKYLSTKFTDNAPNGSILPMSAGAASDPAQSLVGLMHQLYDSVSTLLETSSFQAIPGDTLKVITDFKQLITDPSQFVNHTFGDIITLFTDIAVVLLQLVDAAVEAFLTLLGQIVDAVIALANQPIHIPVITDIWNLITGDPLTFLDLICWIVAVPTTIVQKVLAGENGANGRAYKNGADRASGGIVLNQNVGYLFAAATNVVLDPFMDVFEEAPTFLTGSYIALQSLLLGLNFPTDLATNNATVYIFYAAQVFPIAMTGLDLAFSKNLSEGSFGKTLWGAGLPYINTCYGVGMLSGAVWLGFTDGYPQFRGSNYLTVTQNIFSFIPYNFKFLNNEGPDAKIALGVIDLVGDATAFGLAAAQL